MRRPRRLLAVRGTDGLDDVLARLSHGVLAVDTETSGLPWLTELVGSINLAAGSTALCAYGDALGPVARWLSDQVKRKRELAFHNAKFDMHHLRRTFGLHIPYIVHDTAVMSFVLDNRGANVYGWRTKKPHSLKELASVYVDPDAKDPEKLLLAAIKSKGGKHKGDWPLLLGTEHELLFAEYSALDPWYTLELYRQFIERIRHWTQPADGDYPSLMSVYTRERWLINCFRDMEMVGIQADRAFLEQWRDELDIQLKKQRKELDRLSEGRAKHVNLNSWQQLSRMLYDDDQMGLVGGPKTDAVSLLNLDHPIGPAMVSYRETFKQWSSYANSLLQALTPKGTIHPTFKSTGAGTGRTSCVEPNLQQQTRVSGVRRAYYPRKGLVFRFADYSQVEMRFAAHFANERSLVQGFINDPDFDTHGSAAGRMFGKMYDPTSQHRKFAKIINFTKLFGGGENKVTEQLINLISEKEARAGCKAFGIKPEPGVNAWRTLARAIIERFEDSLPSLTKIIKEEAKAAEARGFMMNAFGGHRFFEKDDNRWYAAFNTRVQGTAGIQAKEGLVKVYKEMQLNRGEIQILLLIHDEIVYESEGRKSTDRKVLELMQDLKTYRVPIIAEMSGSDKNWQDKVKIKL